MTIFFLMLLMQAPANTDAKEGGQLVPLVEQIARSGRVLTLIRELEDGQVQIAPGAPPVLAFRYLEGRDRGRFGGLDLVLDDAGH